MDGRDNDDAVVAVAMAAVEFFPVPAPNLGEGAGVGVATVVLAAGGRTAADDGCADDGRRARHERAWMREDNSQVHSRVSLVSHGGFLGCRRRLLASLRGGRGWRQEKTGQSMDCKISLMVRTPTSDTAIEDWIRSHFDDTCRVVLDRHEISGSYRGGLSVLLWIVAWCL